MQRNKQDHIKEFIMVKERWMTKECEEMEQLRKNGNFVLHRKIREITDMDKKKSTPTIMNNSRGNPSQLNKYRQTYTQELFKCIKPPKYTINSGIGTYKENSQRKSVKSN